MSVEQFYDDPVGFARECIRWGDGEGLTDYQTEGLASLALDRRYCEWGPHGAGQTTKAALATLWFALTRDAAGVDWKVFLTAPAWRSLEGFLWPEITKWSRRLKWGMVGRAPFTPVESLRLSLRLQHGYVFCAGEDRISRNGQPDSMLYVFHDARTLADSTFEVAETEHGGGKRETFLLVSSAPGGREGRFFDICSGNREGWAKRHVTKEEMVAAGRLNPAWVEDMAQRYGQDSVLYQNRVEGNFA